MPLELEREQDLSVVFWLKDLFGSTVNIVDAFPTGELITPTVAVETNTIQANPFELGNRKKIKIRSWYLDIFAKTKSQRDDIAYKILNALEESIPVYDYDMGFPPDVRPDQIGCMLPDSIQLQVVKVMPELVSTLYYRATITFTTDYSPF
jgi:hypothetical protein